jgi:hypothetical protein
LSNKYFDYLVSLLEKLENTNQGWSSLKEALHSRLGLVPGAVHCLFRTIACTLVLEWPLCWWRSRTSMQPPRSNRHPCITCTHMNSKPTIAIQTMQKQRAMDTQCI